MNTKLENALDEFNEEEVAIANKEKKVILDQREGLIERVDRIFLTADGRQLLREQY